jgi:hypothetical protein
VQIFCTGTFVKNWSGAVYYSRHFETKHFRHLDTFVLAWFWKQYCLRFLFNKLWNVIPSGPVTSPCQREQNWVVNKLWIEIHQWWPVEWTEMTRLLCATFKIYQPIITNTNNCHISFIYEAEMCLILFTTVHKYLVSAICVPYYFVLK